LAEENREEASDADLMADSAKGADEAFCELVERHQKTLMNFLSSMGVSWSVSEDVAQEVWIKVYDQRKRYRPKAKFTTFLYALARNKVIDRHRRNKRWLSFRDWFQGKEAHDAEQRERAERSGRAELPDMEEHLMSLPEGQREVVILRTRENLPYQEIAELLGIPAGTVKSRMHLGIKALKERLLD